MSPGLPEETNTLASPWVTWTRWLTEHIPLTRVLGVLAVPQPTEDTGLSVFSVSVLFPLLFSVCHPVGHQENAAN